MQTKQVGVSDSLQTVYNNYYDDSLEEWREIGAKQKVQNIINVCQNKQFDKVLEIGSGSGIILEKLSKLQFANSFYALDISTSSIEQIQKKNIPNLKLATTFDGYQTNFTDKEFDLLILSHVLEHVEHPRLLLREMKRIAKQVVIEVPRDYKAGVDKRFEALVSYGHINLYTPTSLRFLLLTEGFVLKSDNMSMSSKELIRFPVRKASPIKKIKTEVFLALRPLVYWLFPLWRKETMINAYTIFACTESELKT